MDKILNLLKELQREYDLHYLALEVMDPSRELYALKFTKDTSHYRFYFTLEEFAASQHPGLMLSMGIKQAILNTT